MSGRAHSNARPLGDTCYTEATSATSTDIDGAGARYCSGMKLLILSLEPLQSTQMVTSCWAGEERGHLQQGLRTE